MAATPKDNIDIPKFVRRVELIPRATSLQLIDEVIEAKP
jgi:hypothetical protein